MEDIEIFTEGSEGEEEGDEEEDEEEEEEEEEEEDVSDIIRSECPTRSNIMV